MAAAPTAPQREAVVVVLDVSRTATSADRFRLAKMACANLIQQKLIFAPRDEIGLVFCGTSGTLNRLHASAPSRYQHITVARPIGAPSMDLYKHLDNCVQEEGGSTDMLEAILVAADAIYERTGDRRYQRRIFLVSDVAQTVRRKEELTQILAFMKQHAMQLVVIGVDFEAAPSGGSAAADDDWDRMTPKQQNERVLQFMCANLGDGSMVVPVSDALEALSALRKRSVGQRAVARCVLSIGDIRIAVHLFTKTLLARVPSLKKTAEKGLVVEKRYFSASNPDCELDTSVRVKAYRYGKSVIPFTDVDEAQLKFESERSITALGFIPMAQLPMHHLLGGVRVVAPAPGDAEGARALSAFVQAMDQLQRAMLVRFVRVTNADPLLGVCIPSPKAARDVLYFATLPFAEDVRHYQFTTYSDVVVQPEEAKAVDGLVHAMTMDADTLKPSRTFNPALQYYYQCVKARYLSKELKSAGGGGGADEAVGASSPADAQQQQPPLPELPSALVRSSCRFQDPTNVLASMLRGAQPAVKRCGALFPYVHPDDAKDGQAKMKAYWFAAGGDGGGGDAAIVGVKAEVLADPRYAGSTPATSATGASTSASPTPSANHSDYEGATKLSDSVVRHVTTTDPVGTFHVLLAQTDGADNVDRAIFEMTEVVLKLVKNSIGTQYYKKSSDSIDALRAACIKESEPTAFNKFLINLMCAVRGSDHNLFWTKECVARGVRPITKGECEDSDVADAAAADAFVMASRVPEVAVVEDAEEEDLFGQLE